MYTAYSDSGCIAAARTQANPGQRSRPVVWKSPEYLLQNFFSWYILIFILFIYLLGGDGGGGRD